MEKKTKKVTISAICGAIILGGITLVETGPTIDKTVLYNVQKSTYSKTTDEDGNVSFKQHQFSPEYLTLEEIDKTDALKIKSKSNWEKTNTPFWSKGGTHNYARSIYTAKFSPEEIDNDFLNDLVAAFEQGQINDLTKVSVEEYCQERDLPITETVSSWDNWKVNGQCNGDHVIDFSGKDNFAEDVMTVMQVNYDKSITRPKTPTEKAMDYIPIASLSILGTAIGAITGSVIVEDEEKRRPQTKTKKL